MTESTVKVLDDIDVSEKDIENLDYRYQPYLTSKLDMLNSDFNQEIINEIVLWKVNRYSSLKGETLDLLNQISKEDTTLDNDLTKRLLRDLLSTKGIRLAMASTILRFKNPNIYQIIDQRVYRIIYADGDLTKIPANKEKQIDIYLRYLSDLRNICNSKEIPFKDSDRILYSIDKRVNINNKIK